MAEPSKTDNEPLRGVRGAVRVRRSRAAEPELTLEEDLARELTEKVVFINRSAKVVKGGRRFSFSALIVTGDKRGYVGVGMGKAGEVADAIRKGGELARQHMVHVSLKDATIPHEVLSRYDGACVLLRPASPVPASSLAKRSGRSWSQRG